MPCDIIHTVCDPYDEPEDDLTIDDIEMILGRRTTAQPPTGGRWFSCPVCNARMYYYNTIWLCRFCLETIGNLVYANCYELRRFYDRSS
ncbi:unnamed protein product [Aureobasidium vineae]|uniref:Uncharacterized protein n=1 Tax=Aureobasidium vineae TaxID=2773715 RepID=A0A9N8J675_9PEZI|nr:unnamed protein product [Aureobasidium vineae]